MSTTLLTHPLKISMGSYTNSNLIRDYIENIPIGTWPISRFGKTIKVCHLYHVYCFPDKGGLEFHIVLKNDFHRFQLDLLTKEDTYTESGLVDLKENELSKHLTTRINELFTNEKNVLLLKMFET